MIRFACPSCQSEYTVPVRNVGKKTVCPKCGQRLQVPVPRRDKTVLGRLVDQLPPESPAPTGQAWHEQPPPVRRPAEQSARIADRTLLIKCPECGRAVSDKARACPECAYPLGGTVLIEQTSKRWKLMQLIGVLVCLLGAIPFTVFFLLTERPAFLVLAGAVFMIGFVIWATGSVAAWWHHG
ncbi:MAG TPA: zinc-ribbon domain-containing protein [Gemmataceae bacterium]|nr:zinc-ribbon domain-containing protein [Gemmataceae bacterium]